MIRWYKIIAVCKSDMCKQRDYDYKATGRVFSTTRGKITRINEEGREVTIDKVLCPLCKTWADIKVITDIIGW